MRLDDKSESSQEQHFSRENFSGVSSWYQCSDLAIVTMRLDDKYENSQENSPSEHSIAPVLHVLHIALILLTQTMSSRTPSDTRPPSSLSILIINKQLSLLAIPSRLLPRHLDHIKRPLEPIHILEDLIHLLQAPSRRFGVEEVNARNHESVDAGEDGVGVVAYAVESYRGDHHNEEIEDPVCGCGDCVCRGADVEGGYLGGVEPGTYMLALPLECAGWLQGAFVPGHAQPTYSKEAVENEEKHRSSDTASCAARIAIVQMRARARQDRHGESLTGGAKQHEFPSSKLLDRKDGYPGGHEVFCAVAGGEKTTQKAGEADALEDSGGVVAIRE